MFTLQSILAVNLLPLVEIVKVPLPTLVDIATQRYSPCADHLSEISQHISPSAMLLAESVPSLMSPLRKLAIGVTL
jgi:hypothetical protein